MFNLVGNQMKKHFKKSIVLSIVPVFVLAGCSSNEDQARLAVPNNESEVVVNNDGSYSQEVGAIEETSVDAAPGGDENESKLLASYEEAQSKGYTGSLDDWIALAQLHETNPEEAQAKAEESGFSGGAMIMGALAGAAVGAMLASSSNSRSGLASNSYSAQRYNNANNYAYSRPKEERERSSSGGAYGGSTAATAAAASSNSRSSNTPAKTTTTKPSTSSSYSSSNTSTSSYSNSRPTASYSSVSRGGFGGAVSSGG